MIPWTTLLCGPQKEKGCGELNRRSLSSGSVIPPEFSSVDTLDRNTEKCKHSFCIVFIHTQVQFPVLVNEIKC